MAYKPTTNGSLFDDDFRLATSEAVVEGLKLKQDALPSQTSNADKVLVTDGSALSWQFAGLGAGSLGTGNVILGRAKPAGITTSTDSVIIGSGAAENLVSNNYVIAIGKDALNLFNDPASADRSNVAIGHEALRVATTGRDNVALGPFALRSLTTGINNIAINPAGSLSVSGSISLTTGSSNIIMGTLAGRHLTTASNNVAIGQSALQNATTGSLVAIGFQAGQSVTSSGSNTYVGTNAGRFVTGQQNTFIGEGAAVGVSGSSTGNYNTVVGRASLRDLTTGNSNVVVGPNAALANTTGSSNIAIGNNSLASSTITGGNIAIGESALRTVNRPVNNYERNTAIGHEAGRYIVGAYNTLVGECAFRGNSDGVSSTGNSNVAVGRNTLFNHTTGGSNVALGTSALFNSTTASDNIAIGTNALNAATIVGRNVGIGSNALATFNLLTGLASNIAIGYFAGRYILGTQNIAIGESALQGNSDGVSSTGTENVGIGTASMINITSGSRNSAVGRDSSRHITTGNENTTVGRGSGRNLTSGSNNILLGFTAGDGITTGSNNVIIGDIAGSTTLADTMIFAAGTAERFRVDSSGNMGIGTSTPSSRLDVNGAILATEYRVTNYRLDPHVHNDGTKAANFTINWSTGAVQRVVLNAAGPLVITLSNPVDGGAYALRITQGATPGTVTWPASVKWPGGTPPTLSNVTGKIDVINLLYFSDTGHYYATHALDFA